MRQTGNQNIKLSRGNSLDVMELPGKASNINIREVGKYSARVFFFFPKDCNSNLKTLRAVVERTWKHLERGEVDLHSPIPHPRR